MGKFVKGQSGNPKGRVAMSTDLKAAIQSSGSLAIQRMGEMLADDKWFELEEKTQLRLIEVATKRAYGEQHVVHDDAAGEGPTELGNLSNLMRTVYSDMMGSGELPEMKHAQAANTVVDHAPDDDADMNGTPVN
jgi:hypothetical protein